MDRACGPAPIVIDATSMTSEVNRDFSLDSLSK
jgi:hypothetical protein